MKIEDKKKKENDYKRGKNIKNKLNFANIINFKKAEEALKSIGNKAEKTGEEKEWGKIEKKLIKPEGKTKRDIKISAVSGVVLFVLTLIYSRNLINSAIAFFAAGVVCFLSLYFKVKLKEAAKIRKIESVFPDFLQLMASNLRAGMTIDRAMLLSSRPELSPLDEEVLNTGKEIATGRSIESALLDMSKRLKSEKIHRTILLIISGIRAGGNLAVLLEETAVNMREREFVEKKAGGSVLMYVIFIFLAVSVGAPVLFSLSSVLVETLTNVLSGLPSVEASSMNLPFTLSSISISTDFIKYFSLFFMLAIDILASLVLGLVNKGEEKEGLKYLWPILIISMSLFFIIRFFLSRFITGLFGG